MYKLDAWDLRGFTVMQLVFLQKNPPALKRFDLRTHEETTVLELEDVPDGVDVDFSEQRIYWTNMGKIGPDYTFFEEDGTVESCDFHGKNRRKIITSGIVTPKQLRIFNNKLFFCDREGMKVYSATKDGKLNQLLSTGVFGTGEEKDAMRWNVGIQPTKNYVYFTQKGPTRGFKGRICRVTRDGYGKVEELLGSLPEPIDLELAPSGRLYWTDRGAGPTGRSLNSATITDAGLVDHRVIFAGMGDAIGLAVSFDESSVYVGDLKGQLWKIDVESGTGEVIRKGGAITGVAFSVEFHANL